LYCTSVTYFLIESSSFFSCKTSDGGDGGAILFSNGNGQCVLYGVCGFDCYLTYTGIPSRYQFAYIYVKDGSLSKNYVNYSSISRCVNESPYSFNTILLSRGKICCPSVSLSMNKCKRFSGITCYPFTDSSSATSSVSFSSFADNNAFEDICIHFDRPGTNHEMKCCNIIRNTQGTTTAGIISTSANSVIEDSCILENAAKLIFYIPSSSSYSITLSICIIDKTTNNQNLITQNTVTKSFILGLNHLSTQNCNAEYDSIGTLSAIPYISSPTKKLFYYSCKRNDILSRISDFFSLNWLFIITFIHSNPSVDY
jgi:hypothetical protein